MHGYTGKILYVHLDKGGIEELRTADYRPELFLGGPGLGARFLYEKMPPRVDALANESIIGFVSGPLNSSWALFGGRYTVVCKSPVTGGWNDANSGGAFGGKLKKSGYDAIFVNGIADKPVYLFVNNGRAEILDAGELWGLTTKVTEERLMKKHGKDVGIALIGPGGEHKSLFAAVMNDGHRAAARGGPGAVMGSKNLKAVVVKGHQSTPSAHPLKVLKIDIESLLEMLKNTREDPEAKDFPAHGTGGSYVNSVLISDVGFKNWTGAPPSPPDKGAKSADTADEYTYEDAQNLSSAALDKYKTKKYCCPQCTIGCSMFMEVATEKWGKLETSRPEYETMGAFGSLLLNKDVHSVIMANELCNEYGFDTISAGSTIAWAMECYANGVLTQEELGGIDLSWGNGEAVVELLHKIGQNEGIGAVLAQGSRRAAEILNKGFEYLVTASGIEQPQHDARLIYGLGRTYLVDPTPGRHVKASIGGTTQDDGFDPVESLRGTGPEDMMAVVHTEIMNASGSCAFGYGYGNPKDAVIRNIMAVTGRSYNHDEVTKLGMRLFTMRQLFNVREGILRGDLDMSERMKKAPPPTDGPLKGIELDVNAMVDSLYEELGWTPEGVPTATALKALGGFEDLLDDLYSEALPQKQGNEVKDARPATYFTGRRSQ